MIEAISETIITTYVANGQVSSLQELKSNAWAFLDQGHLWSKSTRVQENVQRVMTIDHAIIDM